MDCNATYLLKFVLAVIEILVKFGQRYQGFRLSGLGLGFTEDTIPKARSKFWFTAIQVVTLLRTTHVPR